MSKSSEAREALEYLVLLAQGHDYADGYKIMDAEATVLSALDD